MLILLSLLTISAQLDVERKLDQIDRTFVCPESLPSDKAREAANEIWVAQVMDVEPKMTVSKLVRYRQTLLVRHECTKTIAAMKRSR